jgi:hypothetical protein
VVQNSTFILHSSLFFHDVATNVFLKYVYVNLNDKRKLIKIFINNTIYISEKQLSIFYGYMTWRVSLHNKLQCSSDVASVLSTLLPHFVIDVPPCVPSILQLGDL